LASASEVIAITVIVTEAKCTEIVIVTTAVCVSKCGVTDTMIETGVIIARGAWSLSSIVAIITTTKNAEDGPLLRGHFFDQRQGKTIERHVHQDGGAGKSGTLKP